MEGTNSRALTNQDKVISLFRFIQELNKLKQKIVVNIADYRWVLHLDALPLEENYISVSYRDRVAEEDFTSGTCLLSVRKPEFEVCPRPPFDLREWLETGWDDYRNEAAYKTYIIRDYEVDHSDVEVAEQDGLLVNDLAVPELHFGEKEEQKLSHLSEKEAFHRTLVTDAVYPYTDFFDEEEGRQNQYDHWVRRRNSWRDRQFLLAQINELFVQLYQIHQDLERDSETLELIAANGFLRDRENPMVNHPVLTRRVKLQYDAEANQIQIVDTDVPSELYSVALQELQDINRHALASLTEQVREEDYHPLDRNALPGFLKALVHQLSAESLYSEQKNPENWQKDNRLLMTAEPVFILRKKLDGTVKAIEAIIEQISETGYIPDPIRDLVSGGVIEMPLERESLSLEEQLAAVGGESMDILLSKEANKEQLEIARRIEDFNAVLVQGPPGTGKTHTIANLMGHLLAQGKSVLVTAHTAKALDVLKEKLDPGLQSLCVSVLDDSNRDMEKSVEGITAYMSQTTANELSGLMFSLEQQRQDLMYDLARVRSDIFECIARESRPYNWNGEALSLSAMAEYVRENRDQLAYIPGKVKADTALPLSLSELEQIYRTNQQLDVGEEKEFAANLPDPAHLPDPGKFQSILEQMETSRREQEQILTNHSWSIQRDPDDGRLVLKGSFGIFRLNPFDENRLSELLKLCTSHQQMSDWMLQAAIAGKRGSEYAQRWHMLCNQIIKTCYCSETAIASLFGKQIQFAPGSNLPNLMLTIDSMKQIYQEKGRIPKLTLLTNRSYQEALRSVSINGAPIQSAQDCDVVLKYLDQYANRQLCANYWDSLLSPYGVVRFAELDPVEPELAARNWIPLILKYVRWSQEEYVVLADQLSEIGSFYKDLFESSELDSDQVKMDKYFRAIRGTIPAICRYGLEELKTARQERLLATILDILQKDNRVSSDLCMHLAQAIKARDVDAYRLAYEQLVQIYAKYTTMLDRRVLLNKLSEYAPGWANAIRKREGIHGDSVVPADIEEAWRWKQYDAILQKVLEKPFAQYQKDSLKLGKEYRRVTAQYVEASAWYHLLARTEADIDMKQALNGWKQTIKRIGKGTGKNAPMWKAKARELMGKCQNAVPAWIMPMSKAIETLNPGQNRFDVIIIDEASQADISALTVLYLGRKLIVVGDDKQVSPMAVGVEVDQMESLKHMFINGKIPNAHLYDAKTSLYDLAATTFQPLMLREHFRCMPDIIGFCNQLSYDQKIKPLRDASSSSLKPSVISYHLEEGKRQGKVNPMEAQAIVELLQNCLEQDMYRDKTFGIISMLGDEQVKLIQSRIYETLEPQIISEHRILCGNSANFQGDERDVVFLSLVDSGEGHGPLRMMNYGADDATRKRYNVAVSRAKDQLWIVHSLNPYRDLKKGDIRRMLLEYAAEYGEVYNSQEVDFMRIIGEEALTDDRLPGEAVKKHREQKSSTDGATRFEMEFAEDLRREGYKVTMQYPVGAYHLDMVLEYDGHSVAIECDGETIYNSEGKLREDMERQAILERAGWRFIRVRGSEYYLDKEMTLQRVVEEIGF